MVRKLAKVIDYSWRGSFTNAELNALHAGGFDHKVLDDDWLAQVSRHSLGWVCARDDGDLVGFVNVTSARSTSAAAASPPPTLASSP